MINQNGFQIQDILGILWMAHQNNFPKRYQNKIHKDILSKKVSKNQCIKTLFSCGRAVARETAKMVNGKANPSFIPASQVKANLELIDVFSDNFSICTSEAKTGSVGESTAAKSIAAGRENHKKTYQKKKTPTKNKGIEIIISLNIIFQFSKL